MSRFVISLCFFLVFLSSSASAFYDSFVFGSSHDYFVAERNEEDGRYYIKDQKINLGSFNEFIQLFGQTFVDGCEKLPQKPDLTVKAVKKAKTELEEDTVVSRHFYIDERTVSDGKRCLVIGGVGTYYLPLHRSWFIGPDKHSLKKPKSIVVKKDGQEIVNAELHDGEWRSGNPKLIVNWDFFDKFYESLVQFSVNARLHPGIGKGKPHFELIWDGDSYEAFKVSTNLWALKFPKKEWLVASDSWALWGEMDKSLWEDRHGSVISFYMDKSKAVQERIGSIQSLGTSWSAGIKQSLQQILLDPEEPSPLKSEALQFLKQRPTLDTFGVIVKALRKTDDLELQKQMTKTLRIRNPKGPVIEFDSSEDEVSKAIKAWETWWHDIDK